MALVGAVLAIASMQASAQAKTIALGDIPPGTSEDTFGGRLSFLCFPNKLLSDDITFHLTEDSTISGSLLNLKFSIPLPFKGSIKILDITGLTATFLGNPLTLDSNGNFSYAGILAAGDYLIHISGTIAGKLGGAYYFSIAAAAAATTPIPGALLLFVTAIGGMAGFAGLRRKGLLATESAAA
jgi:hypothetical protein